MFDPDQFHDPEFRSLVRATRAVIAERVHRGVASPPDEKDSPPFGKALAAARSVPASRTVNRDRQPAALSNEK